MIKEGPQTMHSMLKRVLRIRKRQNGGITTTQFDVLQML